MVSFSLVKGNNFATSHKNNVIIHMYMGFQDVCDAKINYVFLKDKKRMLVNRFYLREANV
jgi:hypothetical protein